MKKVKHAVRSASARVVGLTGAASAFLLAGPGQAFAAPQDYSTVGTGATAEIVAIIPVALGVLALAIGIPIAIRIFKRIAH